MLRTIRTVITFIGFLAVFDTAQADTPRNPINVTKAGKFFSSICFDLFLKDVVKAQGAIQRLGFRYDSASSVFLNARKGQQMVVDRKQCEFRFHTRASQKRVNIKFFDAAFSAAKVEVPVSQRVELVTSRSVTGTTEVSARLIVQK